MALIKHRRWLEDFKEKVKEEKSGDNNLSKEKKKNFLPELSREKAEIEKYFSKKKNKVTPLNSHEFGYNNDETNKLLNFLQGVNYEQYMDDPEVMIILFLLTKYTI